MKLMFMFCNNCLDKLFHSASWLVDSNRCTCIFLEEQVETMKLIRTTYWTNGLVTDREMETSDELDVFKKEQVKRLTTGPGIDKFVLRDTHGRTQFTLEKVKNIFEGCNPIFLVQHAAAQMEQNMFEAMMVHGTKEELQRYCVENGMAVPSENRIKLAKARDQMVQSLRGEQ